MEKILCIAEIYATDDPVRVRMVHITVFAYIIAKVAKLPKFINKLIPAYSYHDFYPEKKYCVLQKHMLQRIPSELEGYTSRLLHK